MTDNLPDISQPPPARDSTNRRIIDLRGSVFGRLLVVGFNCFGNGALLWNCKCDCGGLVVVPTARLKKGATKSCGCLQRENRNRFLGRQPPVPTHGMANTPEYRVWNAMRQRCGNPNLKDFQYYGARGITVCPEWASFENFLRDMGLRPDPKLTIERLDNDGPYAPWNCIWATRSAQRRNQRPADKIVAIGDNGSCTRSSN